MKDDFSREFQLRRESLGLTRDEVAKSLGVSQTSVQNWENASHNSFPKAKRWAAIFDVLGVDCMQHRYGVPLNGVVAPDQISNGDAEKMLLPTGKGARHKAVLTDLELLLLTLLRANGSEALGESCLKNLLGGHAV
jgi:transcriptional regulator with XRE-family HTH domain